ncbi:AAA family ATPase [Streptomyces sp. TRM66268-LWL]|uniref:Nuclease SbcCD subunit C n=1 Tax=Streptomyces polyasparticus TaxID=2767826 RepID=A0ABR7STZ6_9ACTN|nr:AAA family ATPase [Streptomyces polyasparticus]MBC9717838.1 AAA family ATPase [Streptomyces polyasparticus]
MKLLKLTLKNFRAFYGDQILDLNVEDGKPAVLIFGNNGAGKTTLLNAFAWALYGKFSDDVEQQHRVIHDQKWSETPFGSSVSASVELKFEHAGVVFSALREVSTVKNSDDQIELPAPVTLTEIRNGESKSVANGQDRIEKILPEGLRRFFFFNGERMEKMFSGEESNDEVKQAIKTLMDLEPMERAISEHLPAAARKLAKELPKSGDKRLQQLQEHQENLEKQEADARVRALQISKEISSYEREVLEMEKALRSHSESKPLQNARKKLEWKINDMNGQLAARYARKREILAKSGFLAFTAGIDAQVISLAEAMRERRELPAGIQRDFIDGLIEDGTCMCGTPVPEGSPAYAELDKRRYNAGLQDVEARWMYVSGQMKHLDEARQTLLNDLRQAAVEIQNCQEDIKRLEEEKSDIDRQLQDVNVEDVQRLERKRKDFDEKRVDGITEHRRLEDKIAEFTSEIEKVKRQFRSAQSADEASRKVQRQVNLVNEVLETFREALELKTEEVRAELDAKVKEVFSRIFIKSYEPELNEAFELHLTSSAGAAIRSTGENQVLGLSFVGAVSEIAKLIYQRKSKGSEDILGEGGIYPVVMDAPFGSLDLTYQKEISQALPKLTSQIVTLLSNSQARGEVMANLQGSATRMYVLRTVTPNTAAAQESIEINNRAVPYVSHGEFEHTVLEEVAV